MAVCNIPQKATVIVYSAKGLKAKNKGKHKFSVIFGVGSNKFRTDVVEDLFGNPAFNTESEIDVGDPNLPLVLTVTEKHEKDILGQVTIALSDLSHSRSNRPLNVPLRPHKKCPNPEGEILMEAWISASTLGPPPPTINVTGTEGETKNAITAGLKKFKGKMSPLLSRKSDGVGKEHKRSHSESLLLSTPKASVSCQDLTTISSNRTSLPEKKQLKAVGTDSLSSLESVSETLPAASAIKPEVNGISPNEGPVEGGTKVTIRGQNLGLSKEDVIGLFICGANVLGSMEYLSSSKLTCITKSWKACVGSVTVETQSGGKGTSIVQFTFVSRDQTSDSASEVSSLSRSSSRGDGDFRRSDSNRSDKAKITTMGTHSEPSTLNRNLKAKSMFDLSLVPMMAKNSKPEVTGIFPTEASVDVLTRLTIQGTHLGQSKADVSQLLVCGVDCLASIEYESSSKIFCSVRPAKAGTGNIIVETHSGGKGSSHAKFSFVESSDDDTTSWAAVPYSEQGSGNTLERKSTDHLEVEDQRGLSSGDGKHERTSQLNGHSPGRLVVEIQPMRMDKKPSSSPFRAWKGKKTDKEKGSSELLDTKNYEVSSSDQNGHGSNETLSKKITGLEHELSLSEDHIKKLLKENKTLRDENERMRKYMENLVNRAIVACPQILCVDDKI